MAGIVVGIDGSSCSRDALRFGAAEARLRGEPLRVVCVWHTPAAAYAGGGLIPELGEDTYRSSARRMAEDELADVLGVNGEGARRIELREGNAAEALIEASRDASMLVVGSRGRGGFARLLLGSVSQQCAGHAQCPVVIVRESTE